MDMARSISWHCGFLELHVGHFRAAFDPVCLDIGVPIGGQLVWPMRKPSDKTSWCTAFSSRGIAWLAYWFENDLKMVHHS